jgi:hypothetical protein
LLARRARLGSVGAGIADGLQQASMTLESIYGDITHNDCDDPENAFLTQPCLADATRRMLQGLANLRAADQQLRPSLSSAFVSQIVIEDGMIQQLDNCLAV